MLQVGQQAPEFTLPSSEGTDLGLKDAKGKCLVLFFYPKDSTPGCTKEAQGFSESYQAFLTSNVLIWGVSKDSLVSHDKFIQKYGLKVPLLSDESIDMITAYGVWQEKKNYGKTYMGVVRTTVVINEDGQVEKIWKNVKVNGHVEAVLDYVKGR